jgi:hypothetical protein
MNRRAGLPRRWPRWPRWLLLLPLLQVTGSSIKCIDAAQTALIEGTFAAVTAEVNRRWAEHLGVGGESP